jgi:hypothetical protein
MSIIRNGGFCGTYERRPLAGRPSSAERYIMACIRLGPMINIRVFEVSNKYCTLVGTGTWSDELDAFAFVFARVERKAEWEDMESVTVVAGAFSFAWTECNP